MKVDITLLGKHKPQTLHFYEAPLEPTDIDDLELLDVLIFPVELVYSIKQLLAIIQLALDNAAPNASMLDIKLAVKNLFYNRKRAFRSYYGKYIVVFVNCDPGFKGKKQWDSGLKSLKGMVYCDVDQVKKTYNISDKQLEVSINLDDHICTAVNLQALKSV